MKAVGFVLALALVLPFVSAIDCWVEHDMPLNTWTYSAWLCINVAQHGWIYSVGPSGHPSAGRMFKVNLDSFTYSSPYPATLTCYEQFTDVNGMKGGYGTLNSVPGRTSKSVPQGPLYSWHYVAQVTLSANQYTSNSGAWVLAGCPPVKNANQMAGSPPQVQIGVNWYGYDGRRSTAIAAPDYTSVGAPFVGYLNGYIDAMAGRTVSMLKTKRTRR
ncbi:hypothetical protein COU36_01415 [Candidatus Micrarchaeota archaeon CG10_big_fil_rev_8_21_14_0_10_59_7]|nr:MAG: hypothetical protein COU36_01415 [Candidatus Micrarchaeota archaeon CG10_big_fil_rev_8_21_14_0_10_59_7]